MTDRPERARRAAVVIALLAIAAVGPACARRRPASHAVRIENFAFVPTTLTVAVGDTVVWTNADIVPHTATARDGTWDSKEIAGIDGTVRVVARSPGRHAYYCVFHPNMQGTLEVR